MAHIKMANRKTSQSESFPSIGKCREKALFRASRAMPTGIEKAAVSATLEVKVYDRLYRFLPILCLIFIIFFGGTQLVPELFQTFHGFSPAFT